MKEYTITMTREQLKLILEVVEAMARAKIGQFSQLIENLTDKNGNSLYDWDLIKQIEKILKPAMGLESNQSWGVGKFKEADELIDIYEVIRYHLAWEMAIEEGRVSSLDDKRDWKTMMGVSFDEPFHWNKEVPLIKVEIKKE